MLPSKYQTTASTDMDGGLCTDETEAAAAAVPSSPRNQGAGMGEGFASVQSAPSTHPPLCLTGVLCDSKFLTIDRRSSSSSSSSSRNHHHRQLHYTVFRPNHLRYRPPLVCVAGGPGLPSTYLSVLVHLVTDRSIVLYDRTMTQPGSPRGSSVHASPSTLSATKNADTAPTDTSQGPAQAMIDEMVYELSYLLDHLECEDYHLFGHSFGGLLVYQYLCHHPKRRNGKKRCRSAILASTPFSMKDCDAHCQELLTSIRQELSDQHQGDGSGAYCEPEQVTQVFRQRHECCVHPLPLPLQQAFQMAGFTSSAVGLKTVRDFKVVDQDKPIEDLPPVLILRGQNDFVTEESCREWQRLVDKQRMPATPDSKDSVPTTTMMTLAGCSHYGMLEAERLFGSTVTSFVQQYDPPLKPLVFPRPSSSSSSKGNHQPKSILGGTTPQSKPVRKHPRTTTNV